MRAKVVIAVSLALNGILIAMLLLTQRSFESDQRALLDIAIRGDERHLSVHAMSLAAIESGGGPDSEETKKLLRSIIASGERVAVARTELLSD